ncbi:hypothetical protein PAQ31011_02410 [Pandoraea aquatica]|uniref:Uncharacterized protein n=1 Tax=Pandoraea aquatica TaxID=2508290 RepID=A0A5E4V218_9BURK|nr:hypothetical protein PAQ31011_02410 [Pandoraea aquatica]
MTAPILPLRGLTRAVLPKLLSVGAAIALSGCGNDPSESAVQNAYFRWNLNLQSKFHRVSDSERDDLREQSKQFYVNECKKISDTYYICDIKGERLLWQLQRFDGDWQISGFQHR